MSSTTASDDEYQVSLCTSAAQLRGARDIRIQVFVDEQGFSLSDEIDQYDPLAAHFILTHKSSPTTALGTLRLLPYPLPIPKPDEPPAEPNSASSFPLGGSRSESAIASDFISAAFTHYPHPTSAARDPAQTKAEEQQAEEQIPERGGAKLGRLALRKEIRGKGLGHALVRKAEAWLEGILGDGEAARQGAFGPRATGHEGKEAKEERLDSIVIKLSSQIYAIKFYEKLGYVPVGDRYDEDGAPHQLCYKQVFLPKS